MTGEFKPILLNNIKNETNKQHEYQGNFRISQLDTELLNYSFQCDNNFTHGKTKNLIITCNDQHTIKIEDLLQKLDLKFDKVFASFGDSLDKIIQIY